MERSNFWKGSYAIARFKRTVKTGDACGERSDRIDIGKGHEIEFVSAPNLHCPDKIFICDRKTQILYTCDAFGMDFCDERTFDEDLEAIKAEFRFYYDCLMEPNARSLGNAMKRMDELGKINIIAICYTSLVNVISCSGFMELSIEL